MDAGDKPSSLEGRVDRRVSISDLPPKRHPSDTETQSSTLSEMNSPLQFKVNDVPKPAQALLFGFQQMMVCISGLLVMPFVISEMACAGEAIVALRVRLISATFVASGAATLLQTTLGLRLCILHGPSFAFLPPLVAFAALPENECKAGPSDYVPEEVWQTRIQTLQGSLLVAASSLVFLGVSGLSGVFSRHVGPLTICPLLILLNVGTIPTLAAKMALHWVSVVEFGILIVFAVFLEEVHVPIPYFSFKQRRVMLTRLRLFGQFPYLLGIVIVWLFCLFLGGVGWEPVEGEARVDKNATMAVLRESPWFQVPYPGSFGTPRVSLSLTLGLLAACAACIMESVGDYEMCARVSHQPHPPAASVNRAIMVEGLGSLIAGALGVCTGVTTYAENIALMHVTKVASRITMQIAGVMLVVAGLFTKVAAVIATIPDALIGGVLAMGMSMICGVALSNLQSVDLRLSRNLTVMGVAVMCGLLLPEYNRDHPFHTGSQEVDDILNMLCQINMLTGGVVAFLLDNLVPGATKQQRGFPSPDGDERAVPVGENGYAFPGAVNRFLQRHPMLSRLPFIPSQKQLGRIAPYQP